MQGFLHWFQAGRSEVKRDLESTDRDELRILTVHGAKGLQAPIVILPDTVRKPVSSGREVPLYWTAAEGLDTDVPLWPPSRRFEEPTAVRLREEQTRKRLQEYRRLLYVAMTRAEDRLIVCGYHGVQGPKDDCWYGMVRRGLDGLSETETMPPGEGDEEGGLRLSDPGFDAAVTEPTEDPQGATPAAAVPDWAYAAPPPEPSPSNPLAAAKPEDADPPARSPLRHDPEDGFQRGLLVHSLLQHLPALPPARREAAMRRYLDRPDTELDALGRDLLCAEVMAVLNDPDFADVFGPGSRAEVPVVGLVPGPSGERVAVSAQIDRLIVRADDVLIVDYKTLRPAPDTAAAIPAAYRRQLAKYKALLAQVFPDRTVRCALLWTDVPRLMPVNDVADRD